VKALACELPAKSEVPLAKWSCPNLAREAVQRRVVESVSASTVRRWLAADALKPWQHRSWISSRDPHFAVKASSCQPVGDKASRSTVWMLGSEARSSGPTDANALATAPERCACRPVSSANVSKIPKVAGPILNAYHLVVAGSCATRSAPCFKNAATSFVLSGFASSVTKSPTRSVTVGLLAMYMWRPYRLIADIASDGSDIFDTISAMQVAVLVTDNTFDSGISTVWDVLSTANALASELNSSVPPWEVRVVGRRRTVCTAAGHRITTVPLDSLVPDLLIVTAFKEPGEMRDALRRPSQRWAVDRVTEAHANGIPLAAACTGTFIVAEAGVLDGSRATTSWWLGPLFRRRYPAVHLDISATLVTSDGITTAGAAFAHIDMALWVVQQRSPALADAVARYLLVGTRASQASFAAPTMLARNNPVLVAFEEWIRTHLAEAARVAEAAKAVGVSERTLQRITQASLGLSPLAFINQIRLDEATHLLRTDPSLSADGIAARVGFQHGSTLGALFRRRRGTTLGALRSSPFGTGTHTLA